MKSKRRYNESTIPYPFRIKQSDYEKLKDLALREDRSAAYLMRRALREMLSREDHQREHSDDAA